MPNIKMEFKKKCKKLNVWKKIQNDVLWSWSRKKKILKHSQIMEDLKKKMDHFNIINTKILFSPKGKKKKLQRQPTD